MSSAKRESEACGVGSAIRIDAGRREQRRKQHLEQEPQIQFDGHGPEQLQAEFHLRAAEHGYII